MQAEKTDTPRVWIACLASYNAGRLVGEWVDATDPDTMRDATERIAAAAVKAAKEAGEWPDYFGEPEEFAIHDYDGFPGSVVRELGEHPDWDLVAAIGAALEENPEDFAAFLTFHDHCIGGELDAEAVENWKDYRVASGVESEEGYVYELLTECGGLRDDRGQLLADAETLERMSAYVRWDVIAEERFRHGTLFLVNGHVFDSEA